MKAKKMQILIRNFAVELIVYGILVVGYSVVVLRLMAEPLARLFDSNLIAYAFLSLVLIITQGVLLDAITSFLLRQLRLEQME